MARTKISKNCGAINLCNFVVCMLSISVEATIYIFYDFFGILLPHIRYLTSSYLVITVVSFFANTFRNLELVILTQVGCSKN